MVEDIIYIIEKKNHKKRYSKNPARNELRVCPICKRSFCILKKIKRTFCSYDCSNKYRCNYQKGEKSKHFGKTYDQIFGEERAKEIRKNLSDGHKNSSKIKSKKYRKCVGCGYLFIPHDFKKGKYCSQECYRTYYVISKETRQKMSGSGKGRIFSEEHRRNLSIATIGKNLGRPCWNKGLNTNTDDRIKNYGDKISRARKGCILPEIQRKKIGEGVIEAFKTDKVRENYKKSMHQRGIRRFFYNGELYRSTWEVKFAQRLDSLNIKYSYEPQGFKLSNDAKYYNYLPDFYLLDYNLYVEIKGYYPNEVKEKLDLFSDKYNLMVLDNLWKIDVFNIGVSSV